jgi:predicted  nucleic acid-binding Zn-ribbon protein
MNRNNLVDFLQAENDNASLRETLQRWQSLSDTQFSAAPSSDQVNALNEKISNLEAEIATQYETIHTLTEKHDKASATQSMEMTQANGEKELMEQEVERQRQRTEDAVSILHNESLSGCR